MHTDMHTQCVVPRDSKIRSFLNNMEGAEDILEPNNSFENLPKVAGKRKRRIPEDWKQKSIKKKRDSCRSMQFYTFLNKKIITLNISVKFSEWK